MLVTMCYFEITYWQNFKENKPIFMEIYYCRWSPKIMFVYVEVKSCQALKLAKPSRNYM